MSSWQAALPDRTPESTMIVLSGMAQATGLFVLGIVILVEGRAFGL